MIGSIFGGGGGGGNTTVTQAAQNKTEVTVTSQIANVIDITALAEAVKAMGGSVQGAITATAGQTQALIAQLGQAQILTQLAAVQEKVKQTELLQGSIKILMIAGAGWFLWRKVL